MNEAGRTGREEAWSWNRGNRSPGCKDSNNVSDNTAYFSLQHNPTALPVTFWRQEGSGQSEVGRIDRAFGFEQRAFSAADSVCAARRADLIESLNNRTVDREARASELSPVWTGYQAILNECQDLKFLPHLASKALVDCVLRPLEQLRVPRGAVVQRIGRYSADHIIGPETVGQVRRQTLPLRVCTVVGSVGRNKDALYRAGESVVAAQM